MKKVGFLSTFLFLVALVFPVMAADQYVGIGAKMQPWSWKVTVPDSDLPKEQQQELERQLNEDDRISLVLISGLVCGGPAEQAGLQKGDVVVAINGTTLSGLTYEEFWEAIKNVTEGTEGTSVTLTIKRTHETASMEEFDVKIVRQKVTGTFDCK